jgi:hypothetical protein
MRVATYQDLQAFMDRFHDASLAKAAKKYGARFEDRMAQLEQEKRAARRAVYQRPLRRFLIKFQTFLFPRKNPYR